MLEVIIDLPDNVLGIEASGKVTANDYQSVLIPALEDKLSKIRKVRFINVPGDAFDGFTSAAAWGTPKLG